VAPPSPEGLKAVPTLRVGPAPVPFLKTPGTNPAAPRPSANVTPSVPPATKIKIGVLITAVTVILGVVCVSAWLLLKSDVTFSKSAPASSAPTVAAPATPSAPAKPKAEPAVLDPVGRTPSPALKEKVRLLPITAAAGGGSQRLSVAGKVYEPGDTVVEGLVLQAIENEEIVFRDLEGNLYTRRL